MKRLFVVKDSTTKQMYGNEYFDSKKKAKELRTRLNDELGREQYIVSPGPDHHKYQG